MKSSSPFFSFGITSYDRLKMLQETLNLIIKQKFSDFEVIVSNDNPKRKISKKSLRIKDPRVRVINQAKNLGEVANMNFLVKKSHGKYFTWLADDDLYSLDFLKNIYQAIVKHNFPECVFTSYTSDKRIFIKQNQLPPRIYKLTGREFLRRYLSRFLKTIGCYGMFKKEFLIKIRGIKKMGSGFGPYSDNLLAIKAGLLDRVIFIDLPLVFLRTHKKALSVISTDLEAYYSAQKELIRLSLQIFKNNKLRIDLNENLFYLLKWFIRDFNKVIIRAQGITLKKLANYFIFLLSYIKKIKNPILCCKLLMLAFYSLFRTSNTVLINRVKKYV